MEALTNICQFSNLDKFYFKQKYTNESIFHTIEDMAPSFNDTMYRCVWQYKSKNCSSFFVPTLTGEGLCFAFNSLNSHEMYTEE